jgi:protein-S-isoprenylcysteine O-methyltransferase Ste14
MSTLVFRYRFWLFSAVFFAGQALYRVDHVNVADWLVRLLAPSLDPDSAAGHAALRGVFGAGAAATVLCAVIRTWAAAYLHTDVVHDTRIHAEVLVANGPYRYVRNPLYLGGLLLGCGLALLASRLGFVFTVAGVAAITVALIRSEERALARQHPASYEAYRRAVPRLIPSLTPRLPAGGATPEWGQAVLGEMFMWIFATGMIAFVITLRPAVALWVSMAGVVFQIIFGAMLRVRARRPAAVLLCGIIAWCAGPRAATAQVVDQPTFDWSGPIAAGATVHILDADGHIAVAPATGSQLRAHGERTHVQSGGRALVFEVVTSGTDITICARDRNGSCDGHGVHGGSHIMGFGRTGTADLTVQLPAGVRLAASSGDGDIDIKGASADVAAASGDGEIHIAGVTGAVRAHSGDGDMTLEDIGGGVDASTGDGKITVRVSAGATAPMITAHSGDGTVTVYLPAAIGGELTASTGDGSIDCDFPVQLAGRVNPRHVRAMFGAGGAARIEISTGDGDIRIKRL